MLPGDRTISYEPADLSPRPAELESYSDICSNLWSPNESLRRATPRNAPGSSLAPNVDHATGVPTVADASTISVNTDGVTASCETPVSRKLINHTSYFDISKCWEVWIPGFFRTCRQLLQPRVRRATILVCFAWICVSYGFYGLLLWLPTYLERQEGQEGDAIAPPSGGTDSSNYDDSSVFRETFHSAIASVPGYIFSIVAIDVIGRGRTLALSMVICAVGAACLPFSNSLLLSTICASVFNAGGVSGWNALDVLSAESFPTSLRGAGFGLASACGRLAAILATIINGATIESNPKMTFGITVFALLLGSIASLGVPKCS
eukprot:Rmarinus@m.5254